MSRNLLLLFLVAFVANIASGVPFRKRNENGFKGFNIDSWSGTGKMNNERNVDKEEPRINEYALIRDARKSRQMSNPHSSLVRTKPFRRSAYPFNKKGNNLFPNHHEIPSFSGKSSMTSHSSQWQKRAPGQMSSARRVPVPEEPEYVY